jgi:hypothetical protein
MVGEAGGVVRFRRLRLLGFVHPENVTVTAG